jgi:hypothetical protein
MFRSHLNLLLFKVCCSISAQLLQYLISRATVFPRNITLAMHYGFIYFEQYFCVIVSRIPTSHIVTAQYNSSDYVYFASRPKA